MTRSTRALIWIVALTSVALCVPTVSVAQSRGRQLRAVFTAATFQCPATAAALKPLDPTITFNGSGGTKSGGHCQLFSADRNAGLLAEGGNQGVAQRRHDDTVGLRSYRECRFGSSLTGLKGYSITCNTRSYAKYIDVFVADPTHTWRLTMSSARPNVSVFTIREVMTRVIYGS